MTRRLVLLLCSCVLLPAALFVVLLTTERGSGWVAARVQGVVPGLHWGRIEGRLTGPLVLHDVVLRGSWGELTAARLAWDWRPGALLAGRIDIGPLRLDTLRVVLPEGDAAPLEAGLFPDLPPPPLPLLLRSLEARDLEVCQGTACRRLDDVALAGTLDTAGLRLDQGRLRLAEHALELSGSLAAAAPHALHAQLHGRNSLPGFGVLEAEGTVAGTLAELLLDIQLQAPFSLRLHGSLRPAEGPRVDLAGEWLGLAWPLDGSPWFQSAAGRLRLCGRPDDYLLELAAPLRLEGAPEMAVEMAATGGSSALRVERLTLRSAPGTVLLNGRVSWTPTLAWSCTVNGEEIDPGRFWPDWPGSLQLAGHLAGELAPAEAGGLRLVGTLDSLAGTLRGFPLEAGGGLRLTGEMLELDEVRLRSGANSLALHGRMDETMDLRLSVQAPDLSALLPSLYGRLAGSGRLEGPRSLPRLHADFSGEELAWREYRLGRLSLGAAWEKEEEGRLVLRGEDLAAGAVHLALLEAELRGDFTSQNLSLHLRETSGGRELRLTAVGEWQEQVWQGSLRDLVLAGGPEGSWRLRDAAPLALGRELVETGAIRLSGPGEALLSGEGRWRSDQGLTAAMRLQGLPLPWLSHWLPREMEAAGTLAGSLELHGHLDALYGGGQILLPHGELSMPLEGGAPLRLVVSDTAAEVGMTPGKVELRLRCGLPREGHLQADLGLATGAGEDLPLAGRLAVRLPDISPLGGFISRTAGLEGQFTLDAVLGGSSGAPRWEGEARLTGLAARLPDLGIFLREGWCRLSAAAGDAPRIEGGLRSGEGELHLAGQFTPRPGFSWPLSLRISGDLLQVADLPEARVWASPEMELTGTSGAWRLSGTVLVPRAQFALEDLPAEVVRRSADEILTDGSRVAGGNGNTNGDDAFAMHLRLALGDDVRLHGFGLTSRLAGGVQAETSQGITGLAGQLTLEEGRYDAFGQRLVIEQGQLIFTGAAMDPGLDLRATRPLPDSPIKPFLIVQGRARKPLVTVTSEPPLPEAEALALLLTGRPLNRAGKKEGSAMADAALALGVSRAEPWLRQLGARFGLDTLEVRSTTTAWGRSALAVGTYLNPDIYLGYAAGIFDPGGAMLLRLRLTERLEVETRAGVHSSADLFYRFER